MPWCRETEEQMTWAAVQKVNQYFKAMTTEAVASFSVAVTTFLVAVVGIWAAYGTWHAEQYIKTQAEQLEEQSKLIKMQIASAAMMEARVSWNDLLLRFDSDEMGEARTTLIRYREDLSSAPNKLTDLTSNYLAYYVYHTANAEPTEPLPVRPEAKDHREKELFFSHLDSSRRRIKNFHQTIVVLSRACAIKKDVKETLLKLRFYNVATFLEEYWLPVEMGQNKARRHNSDEEDHRACEIVAWYKNNGKRGTVTVAGCSSPSQVEQSDCL